MIGAWDEPGYAQCSRAGCTAEAGWAIEWSNPRIHLDGRTKTWVACDEHVEYLQGFLASRAFPVEVRRLGPRPPAADAQPSAEADGAAR